MIPSLETIESHTGGEPLRIVTGGWPEPAGDTILAKRRWAMEHQDHLRRVLMAEPRGHADMYGALPVAPERDDGDLGVLFMHNAGWSTMCGHGVIALVTALIETGRLSRPDGEATVRLDTPAGRVTARATVADGRVTAVRFANVPSFVLHKDVEVEVPGYGGVLLDVAYGGAFYAYGQAAHLGLVLEPRREDTILAAGTAIEAAVQAALPIEHPEGDGDLGFLYGTILTEPGRDGVHSRHACVFADGALDRSPTGTGVAGRIALLADRGEIEVGQELTFASIVGSTMTGAVLERVAVGSLVGVVPEIGGRAFVTGRSTFWVDPDDPLGAGFFLGRGQ